MLMKIRLQTELVAIPVASAPAVHQLLYNIDVRPGHNAAFETYMKRLVESAERLGAPQRWTCHQLLAGGPTNRFFVNMPFSRFSEKDGWLHPSQALVEAFGPERGASFVREGAEAIERTTTSQLRFRPELSSGRARPGSRFCLVQRSDVRFDRIGEYEDALGKIAAAEERAAAPATLRRSTTRGALARYTATVHYDRASELDRWPEPIAILEASYGMDEARRIWGTLLEPVREREDVEACLRPDLSRAVGGPSSMPYD